MQKSKIKIIIFLTFFFLWVGVAQGQVLNLKSSKTSYNVGDSFQVTLAIDTKGFAINAISGTVSIPADKFQILDTRYGNSIISLWVERPKVSGGTITFTGGVPGGFSGSAGPILSFGLRAKTAGSAILNLKDFQVLLNDGQGTEVKNLTLGSLRLTIKEALRRAEEKPKEEYLPPPDTLPPEDFLPLVSRDPSVAENKYFVAFSAVDKDSGISHYEIKEGRGEFKRGESPYILERQLWRNQIIVRAYDQAGNFKEATAYKPLHPTVGWILVLVAVGAAIVLTRFFSQPRSRRRMV